MIIKALTAGNGRAGICDRDELAQRLVETGMISNPRPWMRPWSGSKMATMTSIGYVATHRPGSDHCWTRIPWNAGRWSTCGLTEAGRSKSEMRAL
jgi:hypothetical protein